MAISHHIDLPGNINYGGGEASRRDERYLSLIISNPMDEKPTADAIFAADLHGIVLSKSSDTDNVNRLLVLLISLDGRPLNFPGGNAMYFSPSGTMHITTDLKDHGLVTGTHYINVTAIVQVENNNSLGLPARNFTASSLSYFYFVDPKALSTIAETTSPASTHNINSTAQINAIENDEGQLVALLEPLEGQKVKDKVKLKVSFAKNLLGGADLSPSAAVHLIFNGFVHDITLELKNFLAHYEYGQSSNIIFVAELDVEEGNHHIQLQFTNTIGFETVVIKTKVVAFVKVIDR